MPRPGFEVGKHDCRSCLLHDKMSGLSGRASSHREHGGRLDARSMFAQVSQLFSHLLHSQPDLLYHSLHHLTDYIAAHSLSSHHASTTPTLALSTRCLPPSPARSPKRSSRTSSSTLTRCSLTVSFRLHQCHSSELNADFTPGINAADIAKLKLAMYFTVGVSLTCNGHLHGVSPAHILVHSPSRVLPPSVCSSSKASPTSKSRRSRKHARNAR